MRFIEDPRINRLAVLLRHFDAGDRVLKGRLELFSTQGKLSDERKLGTKVKHKIAGKSEEWLCKNALAEHSTKQEISDLVTNCMSVMNQCYPDYDFSGLSVDSFTKAANFGEVHDNVNYHLAFIVERHLPGFIQDLWTAIGSAISLSDADIYCCADAFSCEEVLFSFDYFFHDPVSKRLLFLSCMTTSKNLDSESSSSSIEEESEITGADDTSDDESADHSPLLSDFGLPTTPQSDRSPSNPVSPAPRFKDSVGVSRVSSAFTDAEPQNSDRDPSDHEDEVSNAGSIYSTPTPSHADLESKPKRLRVAP